MSYFQRRTGNPWSRPIDYDKEIAADLKLIADLENIAARGWFRTPETKPGYQFGLVDLFLENREKARAFDVSDDDLECYAWVADFSIAGLDLYGFKRTDLGPGWYGRGEALAKKIAAASGWAGDLLSVEEHANNLKKAKASLARHRRNQKKYTGKA
jgi:hypothetical protein